MESGNRSEPSTEDPTINELRQKLKQFKPRRAPKPYAENNEKRLSRATAQYGTLRKSLQNFSKYYILPTWKGRTFCINVRDKINK